MSHNAIKELGEIVKLAELPELTELVMVGNPLQEKHVADGDWVTVVSGKLKNLRKLDGYPIIREEDDDAVSSVSGY
jgi:dynein light chain 1